MGDGEAIFRTQRLRRRVRFLVRDTKKQSTCEGLVREDASPCKVSVGDGEAIFRTQRLTSLGEIPRTRHHRIEKNGYRDGIRSFYGDSYGNRTHVTAVKGPCLNRLTNEPNMVADVGFEPTTYRV